MHGPIYVVEAILLRVAIALRTADVPDGDPACPEFDLGYPRGGVGEAPGIWFSGVSV